MLEFACELSEVSGTRLWGEPSDARFVGEVLRERMHDELAYERAMRRSATRRARPLKPPGERYPTREELYERSFFVDSNVLIYRLDASEAVKQPLAARWIQRLSTKGTGR